MSHDSRSTERDGVLRWLASWPDHLGLMVSVGAFALIALRVLAVAGWDTTTAQAIVQVGGAANVALGSALASMPVISTAVISMAAGYTAVSIYYWDLRPSPYWLVAMLALLPAILTVHLSVLAIALVFLFLAVISRLVLRPDRRNGSTGLASKRQRRAVLMLVILVQAFEVSMEPWLPPERFQVGDHKPFMGYAVGERENRLMILTGDPPRVHAVAQANLDREYCDDDRGFWESTVLSFGGERYPACPDVDVRPVAPRR